MTSFTTSTAHAVSPDSGEHWTTEGAWPVAEGVHRVPLPLPMDGLRAVNVYVLEVDDGLVLIDGGWAVEAAREALARSLRRLGAGFADIRRFLITHVHRDHFTLAAVLGTEYGAGISLGSAEGPALDLVREERSEGSPFGPVLVRAGAPHLAARWDQDVDPVDSSLWRDPDVWLDADQLLKIGTRSVKALHTPGHTPGHYVFADYSAQLLFAGDHVLSTITPSLGFTAPPTSNPLGDFMASLMKVRALPDFRLLPAHGPVAPSSHARIDELLQHHEQRLDSCRAALTNGPSTSLEVAKKLDWTRSHRSFDELDTFNQGMAVMETKAHLELLVTRRLAKRRETPDGALVFAPES